MARQKINEKQIMGDSVSSNEVTHLLGDFCELQAEYCVFLFPNDLKTLKMN